MRRLGGAGGVGDCAAGVGGAGTAFTAGDAGAGGGGGGAVCCPVAHAGNVAAAINAIVNTPARGKRSGTRPFMIMTSLLSSTRRLLARMPSTAIPGDVVPRNAAPDNARRDSAYARLPFGNVEMTHASHASSACSRNAARTNQNNGFHHHTTPAASSIQPTR